MGVDVIRSNKDRGTGEETIGVLDGASVTYVVALRLLCTPLNMEKSCSGTCTILQEL